MFPNLPLFLDKQLEPYKWPAQAPKFDIVLIGLVFLLFLTNRKNVADFLKSSYAKWAGAIILLYTFNTIRVYYFGDYDFEVTSLETNRWQRSVLYLVYGYGIFTIGRDRVAKSLAFSSVFIFALFFLDFFNPELFAVSEIENTYFRAEAGFLNANIAGEAVILLLILIYRQLSSAALALMILLSALAVLVTFSRAGMGAWVLVVLFIYLTHNVPKWFWIFPVILIFSYSLLLGYAEILLFDVFDNPSTLDSLVDRLRFWTTVADNGAVYDSSSDERTEIGLHAFNKILLAPISGHVLSVEAGEGLASHNLILDYWYSFGILGLMFWFLTVYFLNKYGKSKILGLISLEAVIFVWFSFFDHQLFTHAFCVIFFAMVIDSDSTSMFGGRKNNNPNHPRRVKRYRRVKRHRPSSSRAV